ncbi:MAG: hypothetical protein DMF40_00840 [Verrucomicrobia bacterium]|nr:MAG: hypothetical protein DMF40_00840 [Verrucomicrobiota bacterium]
MYGFSLIRSKGIISLVAGEFATIATHPPFCQGRPKPFLALNAKIHVGVFSGLISGSQESPKRPGEAGPGQ